MGLSIVGVGRVWGRDAGGPGKKVALEAPGKLVMRVGNLMEDIAIPTEWIFVIQHWKWARLLQQRVEWPAPHNVLACQGLRGSRGKGGELGELGMRLQSLEGVI